MLTLPLGSDTPNLHAEFIKEFIISNFISWILRNHYYLDIFFDNTFDKPSVSGADITPTFAVAR
jgi:hypothetical protein